MVCVLKQAGVGSNASCCLLLTMCYGLGMVEIGSDGSVSMLFVAENGLGSIVLYGDDCLVWWSWQ